MEPKQMSEVIPYIKSFFVDPNHKFTFIEEEVTYEIPLGGGNFIEMYQMGSLQIIKFHDTHFSYRLYLQIDEDAVIFSTCDRNGPPMYYNDLEFSEHCTEEEFFQYSLTEDVQNVQYCNIAQLLDLMHIAWPLYEAQRNSDERDPYDWH